MVIYQGDQYELPIIIKRKNLDIVPDDVEDVIIAVNNVAKSYKKNEIRFHDGKWLFPLTKESTLLFPKEVKYQIEIHKDGSIFHSKEYRIKSMEILDVLRRRISDD